MRLLTLYVRSRQAALSTGMALAAVAALGLLATTTDTEMTRSVLALFAVTVAVSVAATSLSGPDPALERTAALDWRWRRAVHLLALGAVTAGAVAIVGAMAEVPGEVVVRNAVGLTGLAALGATTLGGGLAWSVPVGWTVIGVAGLLASRIPPAPLLTWPVQPAGTGAATVAAVVLGAAGLVAYALAGPSLRAQ